ncbi:MAG: GNAT family N-acetyltransferase [Candidatus Cloacimonetes bacterium]|nr:GNAT family N-acetyltransferase [Candidatus Cloacimonadota bacterium]
MNLIIRKPNKQDLKAIFNFCSTYIDMSFEEFTKKAEKNSDLYFVVYDEGELVGYCLGEASEKDKSCVEIDEIVTNVSTKRDYSRRGIGTKLIQKFEEEVWMRGFKTIGLGCSDNYEVEQFYLKNGYLPIEIVANSKDKELERIKITDYESGKIIQSELRSEYDLKEVNFIFEKYAMKKQCLRKMN